MEEKLVLKQQLVMLFVSMLVLSSCGGRNEDNLSKEDQQFIYRIVPLEKGERIELFETNGGLKGGKKAGNFITNQRLVHYWIDGRNDEINAIEYGQIDSLRAVDKTKVPRDASYLQVYGSNQNNFKIYIDADSARTWVFFNQAMENWKEKR